MPASAVIAVGYCPLLAVQLPSRDWVWATQAQPPSTTRFTLLFWAAASAVDPPRLANGPASNIPERNVRRSMILVSDRTGTPAPAWANGDPIKFSRPRDYGPTRIRYIARGDRG